MDNKDKAMGVKGWLAWSVLVGGQCASSCATEADLGRYIAANCAACHGTLGRSEGSIPSLAGLDKTYIIEQMLAFRSGQRQATVMHQIAKGYADDQIAAVAEFFSQQEK
jgi:cytochrome subunit of sulfide dehydrogenase